MPSKKTIAKKTPLKAKIEKKVDKKLVAKKYKSKMVLLVRGKRAKFTRNVIYSGFTDMSWIELGGLSESFKNSR